VIDRDELLFDTIHHRLGDFEAVKRELLAFLRRA
jgi:hypothetical protein